MPNMTAKFSAEDRISASIEKIARAGLSMTDQLERAGDAASMTFDEMVGGASSAVSSVDGVATSIDDFADAAEKAATSSSSLADSYEDYSATVDGLSKAAERATDANEELGKSTEEAARKSEESSERGERAAETLSKALAAAGIVAAVTKIANSFLDASAAAANFETAAMKISTVADLSQNSLPEMTADIMKLSKATGIGVNSLSEATYQAISASVNTAEAVNFTATATKLAAGGFTTSATSVDVLTTALNAYKLEADQATNISDMLITTQNLGKTSVDQLASSVGKVIPLASAYGVQMDNLSAAYAELTKGGIATAEAGTYLKAMLTELGKSSSTVSTVLKEQTGASFAQLMERGYSLGDVLAVLGDSVNGNAGAFNELWSSSEAGVGALSLYNAGAEQFNMTLDAMQNSVGATESAYNTMTDTTAHAQEELTNSAANLQIAIGQQVNPLVEKLYGLGTNVLNFMSDFVQEHPLVAKAITATAVGLGVTAVALVGVTVATSGAIPAIVAFGVSLNLALGPIGWVALGITALTAATAAFIAMSEDSQDETKGMTAVTRQQYYELQDLNAEYEKACEQYGETSEEALRLKYQVEDLSAAFEANRQTVEEFCAEVDALCDSAAKISAAFESTLGEIHTQEVGALALIQKYEDLSMQANLTAAQEMQLEAVTKKLSQSYPELAAQMEGAALSTEDYVAAMKRACEQEAEEQRQQQARESYVEALQKQAELEEEIAKATENVRLEQEQMTNWSSAADLMAYKDALEQLQAAEAKNNALIAEIEQGWADVAEAEAKAAEGPVAYQEAVSLAYDGVREKVEELCLAYEEAYQAALESFEGQFGLFDKAQADMESTVTNAQAALDSQLTYWDNYLANVEVLKNTSADDLGVTQENYEALMAYAQDGSEQAAGLAASMVAAIQHGNTEAVAALANTVGEVNARQQEAAAMTADWQTGFSGQLDAIEQEMKDTVEGMNLSDEAAASAMETITAYVNQIREGKANAVAAAQEVASAVAAALSKSNTGVNIGVGSSVIPAHANGTTDAESAFVAGENGPELILQKVDAYANGTTNSADAFIAGDDGPELIIGERGSTVFPAQETDRLIAALNSKQQPLQIFSGGDSGSDRKTAGEQVRRILLEIAGSGAIEVSGDGKADKETILDILQDHLKPVLMGIIQSEIYEEGEFAYEY